MRDDSFPRDVRDDPGGAPTGRPTAPEQETEGVRAARTRKVTGGARVLPLGAS